MDFLKGVDILAGVHYQSAVKGMKVTPDVLCIFLRTFDKNISRTKRFIRKLAESGLYRTLIIHTAAFDTNHLYPVDKLMNQVMEDARWCQKIATLPTVRTEIVISPFCEHNHAPKVMQPVFHSIKSVAPNCELLNSVLNTRKSIADVPTDIHISNRRNLPKPPSKGKFWISFDGFGGDKNDPKRVDFPDTDIEEIIEYYLSTGRLIGVRAWNFPCNGKYGVEDSASVFNRKHFPNAPYLDGLVLSLYPRIGSEWGKDKLYKTFAEHNGNPLEKSKDCRAMCILPERTSASINIKDMGGKVIDVMYEVWPSHNGDPKGKRFYSKKFMSEIARTAFSRTGSYLIEIAGEEQLIDSRLRSGFFKDK